MDCMVLVLVMVGSPTVWLVLRSRLDCSGSAVFGLCLGCVWAFDLLPGSWMSETSVLSSSLGSSLAHGSYLVVVRRAKSSEMRNEMGLAR